MVEDERRGGAGHLPTTVEHLDKLAQGLGVSGRDMQEVIVGAGAAARKQESVGEAHLHDIRNLVGGDIGELVRFVGI